MLHCLVIFWGVTKFPQTEIFFAIPIKTFGDNLSMTIKSENPFRFLKERKEGEMHQEIRMKQTSLIKMKDGTVQVTKSKTEQLDNVRLKEHIQISGSHGKRDKA